jgi:hypothetical protein
MLLPSDDVAVKAIFFPSGEITAQSCCTSLNESSAGGSNESLIVWAGADESDWRKQKPERLQQSLRTLQLRSMEDNFASTKLAILKAL